MRGAGGSKKCGVREVPKSAKVFTKSEIKKKSRVKFSHGI